ncbi:hypothetical protein DV737_g4976, partial [Chaetothyriales sp. CBS 132003]
MIVKGTSHWCLMTPSQWEGVEEDRKRSHWHQAIANVDTSYFVPLQWNFHVGGPIALGNILSNPKEPQNSINDEDKGALARLMINDTKPNFKAVITTRAVTSAGLSSSLLQLFGFSANVKVKRSKKRAYTIEAQTLHVQEINPKPLYVEKRLKRADATDHMDRYGPYGSL